MFEGLVPALAELCTPIARLERFVWSRFLDSIAVEVLSEAFSQPPKKTPCPNFVRRPGVSEVAALPAYLHNAGQLRTVWVPGSVAPLRRCSLRGQSREMPVALRFDKEVAERAERAQHDEVLPTGSRVSSGSPRCARHITSVPTSPSSAQLSWRSAGLSIRRIAAMLEVGHSTVANELAKTRIA